MVFCPIFRVPAPLQLNASFGRGYLAGIDMREQRKDSAFLTALMQKRQVL